MRGHSWNLGECPRVVRRRIAQADGAGDGREVVLERVQERSDVVLTLIGFLFILAGIAYKRNEAALESWLSPLMPGRVRNRAA
jgi:hypothetical protein